MANLNANLNRAKTLIDEGRLVEAREVVVEVLYQNYDNLNAWLLLTQCTRDRQEYGRAIREILRIDPDHEQARQMAMQLSRENPAASSRPLPDEDEAPQRATKKRRKASPARVLLRLMVNMLAFLIVVGIAAGVAYVYLESQKDETTAGDDNTIVYATIDPLQQCAKDVPTILARVPARCSQVTIGEACLINRLTTVASKTGQTDLLNIGGDRMELTNLISLETMTFSPQDYTWGMVYMRGLASFPPESNEALSVVVTSGVRLSISDEFLRQIAFSSNPTPSLCPDIAPAGLLVSVPTTQSTAFTVNGEALLLYGTAFLQVDIANGLRIVVLEGQLGLVDRQGRTLQAGQWAKIDVDGSLLTADDNIEVFETAPEIQGNMASLIPVGNALGLNTGNWQSGGGDGNAPIAPTDAPLVLPTAPPSEASPTPLPPDLITPSDEGTDEPTVEATEEPTEEPTDEVTLEGTEESTAQ